MSVELTQSCYYYTNGEYTGYNTYTKKLTPGLRFTPGNPKNMPPYDSSFYTKYTIFLGDVDVTDSFFECPNVDFALDYNFYGEVKTVTCTQKFSYYLNDELESSSENTIENLKSGKMFTPSAHMPDYDSTVYTKYTIYYGWSDYTTGGFKCPDFDFIVEYFFYRYEEKEPKLRISDVTNNSAILYVSEYDEFPYIAYSVKNSSGEYVLAPTSFARVYVKPVPGLKSSKNYTAKIAWSKDGVTSSGSYSETFKTNSLNIAEWDWNKSNGTYTNGKTKPAKDAYSAITGIPKGLTTSFSSLVWNDMVEKVFKLRHADGKTFDESTLSYKGTLMSTDKNLTANRFNSLRHNIDLGLGDHGKNGTGLTNVNPGDAVFGSYFITLADSINDWIKAM